MSRHRLEQKCKFSDVGLARYACTFQVDGSSAVVAGSVKGNLYTVVYSGANGRYTVTLDDTYVEFRNFTGHIIGSTDTILKLVAAPTVGATTTSFSIDTFSGASAAALTSVTICFELTAKSSMAGTL